ncbi:MAG: hypothetical protein K2O32_15070 [Acetatifactor sp.]|nr:hypothetical protein [Acetatifactor sp.]
MYECPNCNGNMKFDISSQNLLCEYCGTQMNPYDFQKASDANEFTVDREEYEATGSEVNTFTEDVFMVNIFTCPQCGGELISTDTTAATFCSFCGGSTILDSRISKEKRPGYIIPFQKTKEDCKRAYGEMLRKAPFAPPEFKDEENISRFRSIYMPYWVYSFEKNEHVSFRGSQTTRSGDYIIKNNYIFECDVEAKYKGLTFDAAASFSDELSNAIAPFEWREARPFTPAYLSGFYADTDDVSSQVYTEDARAIVTREMCNQIRQDSLCKLFQLGDDLIQAMEPEIVQKELAMLPVWFLTYRRGDRVSYAVVNGQTGKVAGDIPVDKKKYLLGSFLLALPTFLLLNLLVSMKANTMLIVTAILAAICCVISVLQKKALQDRETGKTDKGKQYSRNPGGSYNTDFGKAAGAPDTAGTKRETNTSHSAKVEGQMKAVLLIALFFGAIFIPGAYRYTFFSCLFVVLTIARVAKGTTKSVKIISRRQSKLTSREVLDAVRKPGIGLILAVIVLLLHPVSDLYYYGAALMVMGLAAWDILGMIERYNLLATRELPQFHKRGGDEYER